MMKLLKIGIVLLLLCAMAGTVGATNYYDDSAPTLSKDGEANLPTCVNVSDATAPDQSAVTWKISFDGSGGQKASWTSQYGIGDISIGDNISVYGYYKMPADYPGDFFIASLWSPGWGALISNAPHVDFVRDSEWHRFKKTLTVTANSTNPIINSLFESDVDFITYTGDIYINGLSVVDGNEFPPVADFVGNITTGSNSITVQFNDTSTGTSTSWLWNFGDGETSTEQNPVHTYDEAGIYTVSLTAENEIGQTTLSKSNYIYVGTQTLDTSAILIFNASECNSTYAPDMSGNGNDGAISNAVLVPTSYGTALRFNDTYNGTVDFGDSTTLDTQTISIICVQNTSKESFQNIISKRVYGVDGWWFGFNNSGYIYFYSTTDGDIRTAQSTLHASDGNIHVIGASYDGKTVSFYCDGEFINSYDYGSIQYIGSGSVNCSINELADVHDINGDIYSIYVYNTSRTQEDMISLSDMALAIYVPPVSSFTASPTSGAAPLNVTFTDTSTGTPTSWLWNFGDGETSTEQNPTHTYEEPGIYTVSLIASNDAGSDILIKNDYIEVDIDYTGSSGIATSTVPIILVTVLTIVISFAIAALRGGIEFDEVIEAVIGIVIIMVAIYIMYGVATLIENVFKYSS